MSATGITCDSHSFGNRVRITLKSTSIHICAGISLIRITYDILLLAIHLLCEVPFHPCGESCTASSSETCSLELINDIIGSHLEKDLLQRSVSLTGNIFVDLLGIDETAVSQHDPELLLIELDILYLSMFLTL